nr:Gfo/Idh/MocA family oxidoreductase [Clostridia bacterium]
MSNVLRLGVFGLRRGASFCATYKNLDDVKVVAVCERDTARIENCKQYLPEDVKIFDNFVEFIDSGMDAVILANNFPDHGKCAITALNKGIHVLSETNAAPTLGECVQLCEAVENTGMKYMLAANVPHMFGCKALDRIYKEGTFGKVFYAEAEYLHPSDPTVESDLMPGDYHWRRYLPRTYYNMHDLGTLMSITGTLPKKVNAKAISAPDYVSTFKTPKNSSDVASIILTEMDNGSIFRTTACAGLGPIGKWFRLTCQNGTIETVRGDQDSIKYAYTAWAIPEGAEASRSYNARPAVISDAQKAAGHGGSDYALNMMFINFLKGEVEPFFNVHRACTLAAAGILAWRSVLDNGNGYDIPDFSIKAERDKVRNDFLTPFPKADGTGITLPCSSKPFNIADYRK